MANLHKIGDTVKQVVPVIQGVIKEKQFIGDDICYSVEFTNAVGGTDIRWFKESELTGVV